MRFVSGVVSTSFRAISCLCLLSLATSFVGCADKPMSKSMSQREVDERLRDTVQAPHRDSANKARDQWRHPVQTLQFFEVQPNHSVLEVSPGGGWYSEILAPYLKGEGQLTLAVFSDKSDKEYRVKMNQALKEKMAKSSEDYGKVEFVTFEPPVVGPLGKDQQYDRIVTFRNIHSWLPEKQVEEVFKEFFRVLKPGGVLGIVQHRLPETAKPDEVKTRGYVKESTVVRLAEAAGFALAAKSEINSNPKDKASHPKGVWTLAPGYALEKQDRAKYEAIGESDRMTLRFVKP